ncbi:olfactory receptor 5G26-like [Gastrophryne carolinensis]
MRVLVFLALSVTYCATILGNLLIIVLFVWSKVLQLPMYFFITQLSYLDIMQVTITLPNLLHIVLYDGGTMSLFGCIVQFSFFAVVEVSECFLLALMAFDRFLAICTPLHYNSIVTLKFGIKSIITIWFMSFDITMVDSISMASLYYCGPHVIDHFYCDIEPIIELSCSNTSWIHIQILIIAFICVIIPFILILMSYSYIVLTILKITSVMGRQKAFTTCSSHLTGVAIFYGALLSVYMIPIQGQSVNLGKILSLSFTVMTPLFNPIIYTFRNKDFKEAFERVTSDTPR